MRGKTPREQEVYKKIKQLNERLAKYAREYGTDSLVYKEAERKVLDQFTDPKFKQKIIDHTTGKKTSLIKKAASGAKAIRQDREALKVFISNPYSDIESGAERVLDDALNKLDNIGDFKAEVKKAMKRDNIGSSKADAKKYADKVAAVRAYFSKNLYGFSPQDDEVDSMEWRAIRSQLDAGKRPSYNSIYKWIAKRERLSDLGVPEKDWAKEIFKMGSSTRAAQASEAAFNAAFEKQQQDNIKNGNTSRPPEHKKPVKGGKRKKSKKK